MILANAISLNGQSRQYDNFKIIHNFLYIILDILKNQFYILIIERKRAHSSEETTICIFAGLPFPRSAVKS